MPSLGLQIRQLQMPNPKSGPCWALHQLSPISVIPASHPDSHLVAAFSLLGEGQPPSCPPVLSISALQAKSLDEDLSETHLHRPPAPPPPAEIFTSRAVDPASPQGRFPRSWRMDCWSASTARGRLTAPAQVCQRHKRKPHHILFTEILWVLTCKHELAA